MKLENLEVISKYAKTYFPQKDISTWHHTAVTIDQDCSFQLDLLNGLNALTTWKGNFTCFWKIYLTSKKFSLISHEQCVELPGAFVVFNISYKKLTANYSSLQIIQIYSLRA